MAIPQYRFVNTVRWLLKLLSPHASQYTNGYIWLIHWLKLSLPTLLRLRLPLSIIIIQSVVNWIESWNVKFMRMRKVSSCVFLIFSLFECKMQATNQIKSSHSFTHLFRLCFSCYNCVILFPIPSRIDFDFSHFRFQLRITKFALVFHVFMLRLCCRIWLLNVRQCINNNRPPQRALKKIYRSYDYFWKIF